MRALHLQLPQNRTADDAAMACYIDAHGLALDADRQFQPVLFQQGRALCRLVVYINSDEISGLDLRCYFQSGSWNNAWNNSTSTLRDTLFSQNSGPNFFGAFMMQRQYIPLSYTTQADGHFFIAARASQTSTVTATRFFYTSGALDVPYMPPSA